MGGCTAGPCRTHAGSQDRSGGGFGITIDINQEVETRQQLEVYNLELVRINQVSDNFLCIWQPMTTEITR